jgi:hypothetical protein
LYSNEEVKQNPQPAAAAEKPQILDIPEEIKSNSNKLIPQRLPEIQAEPAAK